MCVGILNWNLCFHHFNKYTSLADGPYKIARLLHSVTLHDLMF